MRVITQIPNNDLRAAQQLAQIAERVGFDSIITAENAHGPFLPLGAAALVTDRIQLGTAVAMAFPRSPTIMAHNAWDVHLASQGRFYLGLGAQVKQHNERRFGVPWSPPAPRMRDYIAAVRAVWHAWETETPIDFHSDTYNLTLVTPNFSPRPNGLPRIPISIAAVGPAMLKLGGEVADGVRLHPFSTRRYLDEVSIARISEGLSKSGRHRRNVEVIAGGYGFIGTGPTPEAVAKARAYVRFRIAFYCSTRAYWDVLRLHDLVWLGERVNPLPRENRWSEMAEQIPEELIDLFATVSSYEELPEAIAKRYGGSADTVLLQIGPNEDVERLARCVAEIHRIPVPFEGFEAKAA
ncbi:MAG: TIGR03617 family F420-dependent LLM class oxidoreductase [Hyphomicrobiaceae bacterium]|nr:TIGR03617 family F420-dependent LLM class oxidoreductase [Hyphomicrobiaceae bacterium]